MVRPSSGVVDGAGGVREISAALMPESVNRPGPSTSPTGSGRLRRGRGRTTARARPLDGLLHREHARSGRRGRSVATSLPNAGPPSTRQLSSGLATPAARASARPTRSATREQANRWPTLTAGGSGLRIGLQTAWKTLLRTSRLGREPRLGQVGEVHVAGQEGDGRGGVGAAADVGQQPGHPHERRPERRPVLEVGGLAQLLAPARPAPPPHARATPPRRTPRGGGRPAAAGRAARWRAAGGRPAPSSCSVSHAHSGSSSISRRSLAEHPAAARVDDDQPAGAEVAARSSSASARRRRPPRRRAGRTRAAPARRRPPCAAGRAGRPRPAPPGTGCPGAGTASTS